VTDLGDTEKLVEVYRAIGEAEGRVIQGLLESFGIASLLQSNAAPSVHMFTDELMGEVKVMVMAARAEAARQLLSQTDSGTVIEEADDGV
jgi:hypothetical protein